MKINHIAEDLTNENQSLKLAKKNREKLEALADEYCIKNFGAKTGNKPVRDAFIQGYITALNNHSL